MVCVTASRPGNDQVIRKHWLVTGQVQGVGFRPFIFRLASQFSLTGFVLNNTQGVVIEAQGAASNLAQFENELRNHPPTLVAMDHCDGSMIPLDASSHGFEIRESSSTGSAQARVTIDTALCPDCLREMLDHHDRRAGHALINCTNCGPRYSIIQSIPYDRPNTTMASFVMCPACRSEYESPENRRFHAQPIACPHCGPTMQLVDVTGKILARGNAITDAVAMLLEGKILAIKGLGGFHLAVRACDEKAVARLRKLKHRDAKPFALMCASVEQARQLVQLSTAAESLLTSPIAPIVLAPRRENIVIADEVAPVAITHRLGVMLPYTPIHYLIFAQGGDALGPLVMTSGNDSDEPLVITHDDALTRLGPLCDAILWHDRPIARPIDDSIFIDIQDQQPLPLRRARGVVPCVVTLPFAAPLPGCCLGGELKNTVALVRDDQVILSQHLGNLTHPLTLQSARKSLADIAALFDVKYRWIAHDLHPNYQSTHEAKKLAALLNLPLIAVQHHHAHAAAVLAEHGHTGPAIAIVCDGTGHGSDGTTWGGELFIADLCDFHRVGSMRPLTLAGGGDAAARDPRRSALALLHQALGDDFYLHPAAIQLGFNAQDLRWLAAMMQKPSLVNTTTSMGRYFDGFAALLGICTTNQFEAQAPMALEAAAHRTADISADVFRLKNLFVLRRDLADQWVQIDLAPMTNFFLNVTSAQYSINQLAAIFHIQLAKAWAHVAQDAAARTGLSTVALSGGVFCNEIFTRALSDELSRMNLRVLRHHRVPCNDGGLSYGQAAVAAARAIRRDEPIGRMDHPIGNGA